MDIYAYADDVIREAMASYWKDSKVTGCSSGHFVRRSSHGIKNYVVSKSVDTQEGTKIGQNVGFVIWLIL